jgi:D-alanine transaminase
MPEIAFVNDQFMPLERAFVHVEDRGFQFADAVYEVVRTYGGNPAFVGAHLQRLFRSLDTIRVRHKFDAKQLAALIDEAVRHANFPEAVIYLQITRGRAPRHRGFPVDVDPTLVLTVRELLPWTALRETGVSVITVADNRWFNCEIKSVGLLANVLAYQTAREAGAHDAIFIGADDSVYEATAGNVFIVTDGTLVTPPKGPKILSGVTRENILAAARSAGIKCDERAVRKPELYAADEIFLTSTTAETVPVVAVDERKIAGGKPGALTQRVYQEFLNRIVYR